MEPKNSATLVETDHASEQRHHGLSFLDLPRELREMIYKHIPHNSGVTTYDTMLKSEKPHWKPTDVGRHHSCRFFEEQYGNSGIAFGCGEHSSAILSTCRTIYQEAMPILYAVTPLGIWRPMFDYGGSSKYPVFLEKAFSSLPVHASKYIRILQLQGELWNNNMTVLLNAAVAKFACLQTLEICWDPYYDMADRKHWFDDRAMLRQSWPAISTLHLVAKKLASISITFSPPSDKVWIDANNNGIRVCLSDAAYQKYIWLHFQLSVLKYEITIYGALVHGDAKKGMEFFMDLLLERRDLFEMFQGWMLVHRCIDGTAKFNLEDEREWLREITGRRFEVHEKERRVDVFSEEGAEVEWCDFSYELRPRGLAEC